MIWASFLSLQKGNQAFHLETELLFRNPDLQNTTSDTLVPFKGYCKRPGNLLKKNFSKNEES